MPSAKTFKTSDLVEYVAKKAGVSTRDARKVIKVTFEGIAQGLKKADRVTITGMGSFSKKIRPAQKGGKTAINPFTGQEYITKPKPATTKVKFRPSSRFKSILG